MFILYQLDDLLNMWRGTQTDQNCLVSKFINVLEEGKNVQGGNQLNALIGSLKKSVNKGILSVYDDHHKQCRLFIMENNLATFDKIFDFFSDHVVVEWKVMWSNRKFEVGKTTRGVPVEGRPSYIGGTRNYAVKDIKMWTNMSWNLNYYPKILDGSMLYPVPGGVSAY